MTSAWAAIGTACLLLGGCSSDSNNDWSAIMQAAVDSWSGAHDQVSLKDAAAIPYSTLGVRIGDGPEEILILETDTASQRLWASPSNLAILIRDGRVIRTAGLKSDLTGFLLTSGDTLQWTSKHPITWTADFHDLGLYSVVINCNDEPMGPDPVAILGKQINTVRVEETCRSDQLDWTFTNTYWVNAESGRVWRSIQHLHPNADALQLEILRPPLTPG